MSLKDIPSILFGLFVLMMTIILEIILSPFKNKKEEEKYEKDELYSWG